MVLLCLCVLLTIHVTESLYIETGYFKSRIWPHSGFLLNMLKITHDNLVILILSFDWLTVRGCADP